MKNTTTQEVVTEMSLKDAQGIAKFLAGRAEVEKTEEARNAVALWEMEVARLSSELDDLRSGRAG